MLGAGEPRLALNDSASTASRRNSRSFGQSLTLVVGREVGRQTSASFRRPRLRRLLPRRLLALSRSPKMTRSERPAVGKIVRIQVSVYQDNIRLANVRSEPLAQRSEIVCRNGTMFAR